MMILIRNRKSIRQTFLFIFVLLFIAKIAYGQNDISVSSSKIINEYKSLVLNAMQDDSLIGVGIGLIINDTVLWKEGFGFADKEKQIPFTTRTTLCIGSVTKPITALGIMQLHENGLIDIDKPFVNYLPQFSIKTREFDANKISIRSLVNHTSGIPNDVLLCGVKDSYASTVKYLKDEYLAYPPNLTYHYSNFGYFLLGPTFLEVSGQNYPYYIQNNILEPIGMNNSGFEYFKELTNISKTYKNDGENHQLELEEGDADPAGSLFSNIDDMTLLAKELIDIYHGKQGSILKPETLHEIFSVQDKKETIDNINRGIGWAIFKNDSCFAVRFTGSTHLSNAGIIIIPERKMAAVFQANTVGGLKLANDGINKFLTYVGLEQNDIYSKNIVRERNEKLLNIPIDSLKKHIGLYAHTSSIMMVKQENSHLVLNANFGDYILYPITKSEFNFGKIHNSDSIQLFPNQRFIFKDIAGHHFLFWEDEKYKLHNFSFLIEPKKISDLWKNRLGKYEVVSCTRGGYDQFLGIELTSLEDNLLQLKIPYTSGLYMYNMYIKSDNELIFCGFSEPGGETVSFDNTNQDTMTLFGLKLKKID